ncbi:THUMP domain containing protein [Ascosphaera apis ARSEF 7405]|uniref:THUMP domain containing protein n=1 Tax=Ascosphaera apis ARSEF 7405 TaxID=392613 RepID=A0A168CCV7_9EURO|nr:THUMP domain containing protein [Ascosphaera apis ARSEF 7405]
MSVEKARQQQKRRPNTKWKQGKFATKGWLESGQCGIFVTCNRNQESRCISEMVDILSDDLEQHMPQPESDEKDGDLDDDIEAQIRKEVEELQPKNSKAPFQAIRLEVPCVSFIRLDNSLDPVQIVRRLCSDAVQHPEKQRSRKIQRMTPVTLVRKVLGDGLKALAQEVLAPHFHAGGPPKKYAIRPTIRQNADWHKDSVAKVVADVVGPNHPVDLKNYDVLILVEVMRNICAMSVVGKDYDELKRYNLAEIYNPTPKPQIPQKRSQGELETSKGDSSHSASASTTKEE